MKLLVKLSSICVQRRKQRSRFAVLLNFGKSCAGKFLPIKTRQMKKHIKAKKSLSTGNVDLMRGVVEERLWTLKDDLILSTRLLQNLYNFLAVRDQEKKGFGYKTKSQMKYAVRCVNT